MVADNVVHLRAALEDARKGGLEVQASYTGIVGLVIAVLRRGKSLSQNQLAARSGVSQPTISRIELGEADPTMSQMDAVAAALGTSTSVIVQTAEQFRKILQEEKVDVPVKAEKTDKETGARSSLIGAGVVVTTGALLGGPIGFAIGSAIAGILVSNMDKNR